jgi:hypothetical protein
MNPLLNELSRKLLGKEALADCSLQELEAKAARYPAFASLQILLAARKRQMNPELASTFSGKAAFFLHNPLWAEECLQATQEPVIAAKPIADIEQIPSAAEPNSPYQAELESAFTDEELVVQTEGEPSQLPLGSSEIGEASEELEEEVTLPEEELHMRQVPLPAIPGPMPIAGTAGAKAADDLLTFEPYHTVDYFASQGIRYREEQKEKDRFSVQLRSFTEWLKTMKRLPANEQVPVATVSEEKKVEQMAEVSIAPREIVTETMAEVWEKQGNREKAMQLYQKLSLLDPAKSAYFAAKIDKLKHS